MDTGKDKVKKICDALRKETLEPAKREADEILEAAAHQAERMLAEAQAGAERLLAEAHREIQKQKNIYEASLNQACKQAMQALKQSIEEKLFNPSIAQIFSHPLKDPQIIAKLINAIVGGIEKEGIEADLSVAIGQNVQARAVNELLAKQILDRLREKGVVVGPIRGGIEVKLHKDNLTVELTEEALRDLVSDYVRKDFRELLFGSLQ